MRYFACAFLIHRPVLYFFLHKDMEYTIQPPNTDGGHLDLVPWVLESCRDCIESAALYIDICYTGPVRNGWHYRNWCDYQLLFAAYFVILQAKALEVFEPIFRNVKDAETLLDQVEEMHDPHFSEALILMRNQTTLKRVRREFDAASPRYSR